MSIDTYGDDCCRLLLRTTDIEDDCCGLPGLHKSELPVPASRTAEGRMDTTRLMIHRPYLRSALNTDFATDEWDWGPQSSSEQSLLCLGQTSSPNG